SSTMSCPCSPPHWAQDNPDWSCRCSWCAALPAKARGTAWPPQCASPRHVRARPSTLCKPSPSKGTTPMRTDLWRNFQGLLAESPRLLATVVAHNADGTSSLVTADGQSLRAWGQLESLSVPYNVFVQDGKLE